MTRVHERHASAVPSAADRHRKADQKRKASYKVILEEVADKQKKLKTVLYPGQKAPRGYTFIPAGDPQLTNRCKKLAREDGLTVFIVSTSRHPRKGLSREVHRVGFHFPSVTVEKACDSLGVTLSNSGRVLQSNFAHLDDGPENDGKRSTKQKKQKAGNRNAQPVLDISLPQAVIDTSARETIKDLFPNIPSQDLHVIVGRSFQKGKGLVGTVANLSLVRRAQLAVIAHIRHTYTDYDALLRQVQYNEARRRVEQPCLDRLIQWRGDDDDAGDMEDVLREVIVIPDDDEEDHGEGDKITGGLRKLAGENERDSSVEYMSETDMQIQPVDYSNINRTVERGDSYSPESDKEVQYLGRNILPHSRQVQYDQHTLDRMGTHRQRVYEEALDRRRKHSENLNVQNGHHSLSVFANSGHDEIHPLLQQPRDRDFPSRLPEHGAQALMRAPIEARLMPVARLDGYRADPYSNARDPRYVIEEQVSPVHNEEELQWRTMELEVAYPFQQHRRMDEGGLEQPKRVYHTEEDELYNNGTRQVEVRQPPTRAFNRGERFMSQNDDGQDVNNLYAREFEMRSRRRSEMVLPSIERDLPDEHSDWTSLHGEKRQVNPSGPDQPFTRGIPQLPAPSIIDLHDYEELPNSKRRRIDYQQPVSSRGQARTMLVPIEQIDDRGPRYERPREALYRNDTGHTVLDKRIVPLPPKEERARSLISHERLQQFSPRNQMMRCPDQVADRVERYPRPHDHYQIPLSRSENVEDLQFPSRAVFAPQEHSKDSHSFFESSQFAPRHLESTDLGFPSRHDVGVIANSDRVHAESGGMTRYLQPLDEAERSMPSRFSDMSIDCRQSDDGRRPDRVAYHPFTATTTFRRHTGPDTAKDAPREGMEAATNAYPPDISGRHIREIPGVQEQPISSTRRNVSSYHPLNHHFPEPYQANVLERSPLPPTPRAAMEPWDTNMQSRIQPLDEWANIRRPHSRVSAVRPENIQPFQREHNDFSLRQRKRQDDFVVLD